MGNIIYVEKFPANKIFGSVGRCGSGPCTVWEDWSPSGIEKREIINQEYMEGINKINQHYTKIMDSVKNEGVVNPLIVTRGRPYTRNQAHFTKTMWDKIIKGEILVAEGVSGGSRLWAAQRLDIDIPVIINDRISPQMEGTRINTIEQGRKCFPSDVEIFFNNGRICEEAGTLKQIHHNNKSDRDMLENFLCKRTLVWINVMGKQGYHTRLNPKLAALMRDYEH